MPSTDRGSTPPPPGTRAPPATPRCCPPPAGSSPATSSPTSMTEVPSLKAIWRRGGTALGGWLSLREPVLAEAAGSSGYDYVCIDMQHGLADYEHAVVLLHALAGTGAVPVVRV